MAQTVGSGGGNGYRNASLAFGKAKPKFTKPRFKAKAKGTGGGKSSGRDKGHFYGNQMRNESKKDRR